MLMSQDEFFELELGERRRAYGELVAVGSIVISDFKETFFAPLGYWSEAAYQKFGLLSSSSWTRRARFSWRQAWEIRVI
ncbi:hypothetical protein VARIO8X_60348 [Burkholderiales bacterium 8X]|nr:hypothetical protein VARIO8X_60348 [Burkholderiales bacterium 8X]